MRNRLLILLAIVVTKLVSRTTPSVRLYKPRLATFGSA